MRLPLSTTDVLVYVIATSMTFIILMPAPTKHLYGIPGFDGPTLWIGLTMLISYLLLFLVVWKWGE